MLKRKDTNKRRNAYRTQVGNYKGQIFGIQAHCPSLNRLPCAPARLEPGPRALISKSNTLPLNHQPTPISYPVYPLLIGKEKGKRKGWRGQKGKGKKNGRKRGKEMRQQKMRNGSKGEEGKKGKGERKGE